MFDNCCLFPYFMSPSGIADSILCETLKLEVYSTAENGNWSGVSIISFWKVIRFNVGYISFIAGMMFLCLFRNFKFVLTLVALN